MVGAVLSAAAGAKNLASLLLRKSKPHDTISGGFGGLVYLGLGGAAVFRRSAAHFSPLLQIKK